MGEAASHTQRINQSHWTATASKLATSKLEVSNRASKHSKKNGEVSRVAIIAGVDMTKLPTVLWDLTKTITHSNTNLLVSIHKLVGFHQLYAGFFTTCCCGSWPYMLLLFISILSVSSHLLCFMPVCQGIRWKWFYKVITNFAVIFHTGWFWAD